MTNRRSAWGRTRETAGGLAVPTLYSIRPLLGTFCDVLTELTVRMNFELQDRTTARSYWCDKWRLKKLRQTTVISDSEKRNEDQDRKRRKQQNQQGDDVPKEGNRIRFELQCIHQRMYIG
ncbi:unnamed protein product, partial [Ectocarpus sp. 12 AP-2014]